MKTSFILIAAVLFGAAIVFLIIRHIVKTRYLTDGSRDSNLKLEDIEQLLKKGLITKDEFLQIRNSILKDRD